MKLSDRELLLQLSVPAPTNDLRLVPLFSARYPEPIPHLRPRPASGHFSGEISIVSYWLTMYQSKWVHFSAYRKPALSVYLFLNLNTEEAKLRATVLQLVKDDCHSVLTLDLTLMPSI